MHEQNAFLTLTYDDDHLPKDAKLDKPQLTYKIKEMQRKIKGIRFFFCGEYGEKTNRPHYHAIIFGSDLLGGAEPIGDNKYISPLIQTWWPYGNHELSVPEYAAAFYTAGYVTKKMDDTDTFSIMSRKPPIGHQWLKQNYESMLTRGFIIINGVKHPIPKMYMDTLQYKWGLDLNDYKYQRRQENKNRPILTKQQGRAKELNLKQKIQSRKATI